MRNFEENLAVVEKEDVTILIAMINTTAYMPTRKTKNPPKPRMYSDETKADYRRLFRSNVMLLYGVGKRQQTGSKIRSFKCKAIGRCF